MSDMMAFWAGMYGLSPEQIAAASQPNVPIPRDHSTGIDPHELEMPNCIECATSQECHWCLRKNRCSTCLWPLARDKWCSFCDAFDWQASEAGQLLGTRQAGRTPETSTQGVS